MRWRSSERRAGSGNSACCFQYAESPGRRIGLVFGRRVGGVEEAEKIHLVARFDHLAGHGMGDDPAERVACQTERTAWLEREQAADISGGGFLDARDFNGGTAAQLKRLDGVQWQPAGRLVARPR